MDGRISKIPQSCQGDVVWLPPKRAGVELVVKYILKNNNLRGVFEMNFNELELLKMAQKIEQEGESFYIGAAERANDDKIKEMFLKLAREERFHGEYFGKLYEEALEKSSISDEYLLDEHTSAYISAISSSAVFNKEGIMAEMLGRVETAKEAIIMGIQAEKDSILFYSKLYENTRMESAKDNLKKLITEEEGHLNELLQIYKNI